VGRRHILLTLPGSTLRDATWTSETRARRPAAAREQGGEDGSPSLQQRRCRDSPYEDTIRAELAELDRRIADLERRASALSGADRVPAGAG